MVDSSRWLESAVTRAWRITVLFLITAVGATVQAGCGETLRHAEDARQRVVELLKAFDGSGPPPAAQLQKMIDAAREEHLFYSAALDKHEKNFQRGAYKGALNAFLNVLTPMSWTPVSVLDMVTSVFEPTAKSSKDSFILRHKDQILAEADRQFAQRFPGVDISRMKEKDRKSTLEDRKYASGYFFIVLDVVKKLALKKRDQTFARAQALIKEKKQVEKEIAIFERNRKTYYDIRSKHLPLPTWKKARPPPAAGIEIEVDATPRWSAAGIR